MWALVVLDGPDCTIFMKFNMKIVVAIIATMAPVVIGKDNSVKNRQRSSRRLQGTKAPTVPGASGKGGKGSKAPMISSDAICDLYMASSYGQVSCEEVEPLLEAMCPTQEQLCDPSFLVGMFGPVKRVPYGSDGPETFCSATECEFSCVSSVNKCCDLNCCEDNPGKVPVEQLCAMLALEDEWGVAFIESSCVDYDFDLEFCPCDGDAREPAQVCDAILASGGASEECMSKCESYVTNCCESEYFGGYASRRVVLPGPIPGPIPAAP